MIPVLSIIIPTFNAQKIINDALESIAIQTFESYEVLVIDGVSNDNTIAVVQEYARIDDRIIWISEKDRGIYDAMNKGLAMARGEWIYFMGSDDRLMNSSVLESVFNDIDIQVLDVIYGNVILNKFDRRYDGAFTLEKLLDKNICHQAIFFKRKVFDITGNFNLMYKVWADYDHNLKWFLNQTVKRKYVSVDVAYYYEGGYSSYQGDFAFIQDKMIVFFKYALKAGKNNLIKRLASKEIKFQWKKKNFRRIVLPAIVYMKQTLING